MKSLSLAGCRLRTAPRPDVRACSKTVAQPVFRLHPADCDHATTGRTLDGLIDWYPVIHPASPESDGSSVAVETTAKGKRSLLNAAQLAEQVGVPADFGVGEPPLPA